MAVTVGLNHEEIKKYPQTITIIKPFIHTWEGINFPSEKYNRKKIEIKNLTIDLHVLYAKKENVYPAYGSKHNSNHEKQVILLMIPNEKKWNYLAVKNHQHLKE